jgi:hypothetical protein
MQRRTTFLTLQLALKLTSVTAIAVVCLLWAGMILGISFLEAPAKFTTPSLTLAVGLDVGRHVFGAFNKVEIGAGLLVVGLMLFSAPPRAVLLPLGMAVSIVALQSAWLLPLLDARVEVILRGQMPPPAPFHLVYIVLELLKLACLLGAGTASLKALQSVSLSAEVKSRV